MRYCCPGAIKFLAYPGLPVGEVAVEAVPGPPGPIAVVTPNVYCGSGLSGVPARNELELNPCRPGPFIPLRYRAGLVVPSVLAYIGVFTLENGGGALGIPEPVPEEDSAVSLSCEPHAGLSSWP